MSLESEDELRHSVLPPKKKWFKNSKSETGIRNLERSDASLSRARPGHARFSQFYTNWLFQKWMVTETWYERCLASRNVAAATPPLICNLQTSIKPREVAHASIIKSTAHFFRPRTFNFRLLVAVRKGESVFDLVCSSGQEIKSQILITIFTFSPLKDAPSLAHWKSIREGA